MFAIEKKGDTTRARLIIGVGVNVSPHQRADVSYGVFPCESLNLLLHHSFIFNFKCVLNLRHLGIN